MSASRIKISIAVAALAAVAAVQVEIPRTQDGITLEGTAQIEVRDAGFCQVSAEHHSSGLYERMKANHGQPLHVWRLQFAARRFGEVSGAADGTFQHRVGGAAMYQLERSSREPRQADAVGEQLPCATKARRNGTGNGGWRHRVRAGIPRPAAEVRTLEGRLPRGPRPTRP